MTKSSPVDLVTETDQKVENFIISLIKEKYPSHRYDLLPVCFWQKKNGKFMILLGKGLLQVAYWKVVAFSFTFNKLSILQ